MNNFEKRLEAARHYINFGINEGVYDPERFEGMTDQELVEFAEKEMDRADAYIEVHKEQYENN